MWTRITPNTDTFYAVYTTQNNLFIRIQSKRFNQIFFKFIKIYMVLEKSVSKVIASLLPKIYLITFFLVVTAIGIRSVFFSLVWAFKPFADCTPYSMFSSQFFHSSKYPHKCLRYQSCWLYQFPLIQTLAPYSSPVLYLRCSQYYVFCILTQCQLWTYFLRGLAQWHDLLNHVVFQYYYAGLGSQDLICLAWLYVFSCL